MSARCPGPARVRTSVLAAGVLTVVASALPAQDRAKQDRLATIVDEAIADLQLDDARDDALRRLCNLGKLAVPRLQHHLAFGRRGDLSRLQQQSLIYVAGRLGRDGLVLVPDLLDWLREGDSVITPALLESLTWFVPFLDDEAHKQVDEAARIANRLYGSHTLTLLVLTMQFGREPTADALATALTHNWYRCHAVARWLLARGPGGVTGDTDALAAGLRAALENAMRRDRVSFQRGTAAYAPEIARAWLQLTEGLPDAIVARALLADAEPDVRRRGIAWLAERGAALPLEQRCDLVARLWDDDPDLVAAAATALADWGKPGVVGLARLRSLDGPARAVAQNAADTIVASFANGLDALPPNDLAWLETLDARLRHRDAAPPDEPPGPAARRVLAEVATMATWERESVLLALVDLLDGCVDDEIVRALYCWFAEADPSGTEAVLALFARHPRHANQLLDALPSAQQVQHPYALQAGVSHRSRSCALEAIAWLATADRGERTLRAYLRNSDLRLAARACAALLVQHRDALRPALPALRDLVRLPLDTRSECPSEHGGLTRNYNHWELALPLRTLAALALAELGEVELGEASDDHDERLAAAVRERCGTTLAELPGLVARRRAAGTLHELVDELEAWCRETMYVPETLRWPGSAARAPR